MLVADSCIVKKLAQPGSFDCSAIPAHPDKCVTSQTSFAEEITSCCAKNWTALTARRTAWRSFNNCKRVLACPIDHADILWRHFRSPRTAVLRAVTCRRAKISPGSRCCSPATPPSLEWRSCAMGAAGMIPIQAIVLATCLPVSDRLHLTTLQSQADARPNLSALGCQIGDSGDRTRSRSIYESRRLTRQFWLRVLKSLAHLAGAGDAAPAAVNRCGDRWAPLSLLLSATTIPGAAGPEQARSASPGRPESCIRQTNQRLQRIDLTAVAGARYGREI